MTEAYTHLAEPQLTAELLNWQVPRRQVKPFNNALRKIRRRLERWDLTSFPVHICPGRDPYGLDHHFVWFTEIETETGPQRVTHVATYADINKHLKTKCKNQPTRAISLLEDLAEPCGMCPSPAPIPTE